MWMNPPDKVKRFSTPQVIQHWAVIALGAMLVLSGAGHSVSGSPALGTAHQYSGLLASGFLAFHFLYLVGIGIRNDVPLGRVAFLPAAREWEALRGRSGQVGTIGKYSPEEKADYLLMLFWATTIAITGIAMRWPGTLGLPGVAAYQWVRVIHAGCGSALVIHVACWHLPGRWFRAPEGFRRAILAGSVSLEDVVGRRGWIDELVSAAVLVPVPSVAVQESEKESGQVRDLLEEGNRMAREGKYEEACLSFGKALELYPGYSQARYNLAIARMRQGRNDLAREHFRMFVENDPFNPMAERARELLDGLAENAKGGQE